MFWRLRPDPALIDLLARLDGEALLTGPDRDPAEAEIDPVFAAPFGTAIADLRVDAGLPRGPDGADPLPGWLDLLDRRDPLATIGEARLHDATAPDGAGLGVLLLQNGTEGPDLIGLFTGPTLCVRPEHRGLGYGRALVAARLMREGALPTWGHDTPGYSPAGAATVRGARALLLALAADPQAGTSLWTECGPF